LIDTLSVNRYGRQSGDGKMVDLEPPDLTKRELKGDLQDGMLAWYQSQAPLQDAQVEKRIEKEGFFLADYGPWTTSTRK
jgi:hypothetical protein